MNKKLEIYSERLQLRPLAKEDWVLFETLHRTPSVIAQCFDPPTNKELQLKFAERLGSGNHSTSMPLCLCVLTQDGQKIGILGYSFNEKQVREIGYLYLPEFHGKGYASEALNELIRWCEIEIEVTEFAAVVSEGNVGSMKVLERAGFTLMSIEKDAFQIGGEKITDYYFSYQKMEGASSDDLRR
ncbi:GNAT family N-acetyltransferase [Pseudoalteromonas xiamenensis]|uniref:GNAT family N-acetyltransferase n=1 Tax=Pseudoalteromonas xiamenensis TaxID=882626 RepID=UPI0027E49AC0|nr:GNAT family N-acetyltransferase [Pseudoalteromonas xiamenensis]WMN59691.1 GNAT family N-acetyltransferase [Pseudoalteromonas xiamenensis]